MRIDDESQEIESGGVGSFACGVEGWGSLGRIDCAPG